MKGVAVSVLALLALPSEAANIKGRDVDTMYPYMGPNVPVGDAADQTVNGNGKGWQRVVEAPAVAPASSNPTNNINVINTAYFPGGMNIHFQTPFGLASNPAVKWGKKAHALTNTATGSTKTYGRVPSCSQVRPITSCNEFFHDVTIDGLKPSTTYFYQIQAANGTTASKVMSFKTARAPGDKTPYVFGVLNDMGYTYAGQSHHLMLKSVENGEVDFFAHGGDMSYADDWNYGLLPCKSGSDSVCYAGADSTTSGEGPIEPDFLEPLPKDEQPTRGTPRGGDAAPLYETNWDVWQQWMNNITTKVPYMVAPGNHESGCVAHDANNLTANYLNHNKLNSTAPTEQLNYYSCPPSQRNFTTYQHRYTMPGDVTGGVGNFWYSWNYGLVHFVMLNAETDYPNSPESSFATDLQGKDYDHVKPEDTGSEDSGPFGAVNGDINDPQSYEQVQWVAKDLAAVDRAVTPWVVVIGHRPFYSSSTADWQDNIRAAFETIFLDAQVDAYLAGHIHFYERMRPLGANGWIDTNAQIDNHTYVATGNSITHLTNGAAGNLGSHDTIGSSPILNITQHLDDTHFGFVKAHVNETALVLNYHNAVDGAIVDHVTILKPKCSRRH